jgi:nucleoid-associated protein YgaU
MQEVTCPQCENIVHITPDSPLCSICGTDLDELVSPEFAAGYFYKRASDMATGGRKQQALTEVNRGLTYNDTSDLRLLGAILANQLGDFGQMRNHVAAIPVDDALREEGEWILRSHQAKRRAQRTSTKNGQQSSQDSVLPFPINGEEDQWAGRQSKKRNPWPVLIAIGIVTLLTLIWFVGVPGTRPEDSAAQSGEATIQPDEAEIVTASEGSDAQGGDVQPVDSVENPAEEPAAQEPENAENDASGVAEPPTEVVDEITVADDDASESDNEGNAILPTPTTVVTEPPTPTVEPTPEEISTDGPVDVIAFLVESGYAGLADSAIEGELVDGVLMLTGEVPMMEILDVLVSGLSSLPNAESINTEGVVLTPPKTYKVRAGDNLWIISVRVYGDTEHMNDIFRENRDILPSPEILTVGAEIKLPPYNPE